MTHKPRLATVVLILVAVFVALASGIACFFILHAPRENVVAQIYQDDNLLYTIDLDTVTENYTITVSDDDGAQNVILVEKGRISMLSANCPDQLCVRQGAITDGLVPIVCLPHKVRISIVSKKEENADVVVP